jgi:hypothetical protein
MKLPRRRFLQVGGEVMLAFAANACGQSTPPDSESSSDTTDAAPSASQ